MTSLVVPISVKVFRTSRNRADVASPLADFSALPWTKVNPDGSAADQNPEIAYTSRNVLRDPFSTRGGMLERGIHLHWQLPRALTVGHQRKNASDQAARLVFPTVPNRWAVRRSGKGIPTRHWIVESDFLWGEGETPSATTVTYPFRKKHITPNNPVLDGLLDQTVQPFRYLGRTWEPAKETWRDGGLKGDKPKLTAVGYGEPAFAAYYPNCRNIFGLHDDCSDCRALLHAKAPTDLRYEIIGGYSDAQDDPIDQIYRGVWLADPSTKPGAKAQTQDIASEVLENLGWRVPAGNSVRATLCFGQVRFAKSADASDMTPPARAPGIAVGNTGTEALSAYLAQDMVLSQSSEDASVAGHSMGITATEHQLEAITLLDATRGHRIDLGPKFKEARHNKGFHAVPGGRIWTLRPVSDKTLLGGATDHARAATLNKISSAHGGEHSADAEDTARTKAQKSTGLGHAGLPPVLAMEIQKLNALQLQFDRTSDRIASMRRLIHAQWQKYLSCCYFSDASAQGLPSMDTVKAHIEGLIALLDATVAYAGAMRADHTEDTSGNAQVAHVLLGFLDEPAKASLIPTGLLQDPVIDWCRSTRNGGAHGPSLVVALAHQAAKLKAMLQGLTGVTAKAHLLKSLLQAPQTPENDAAIDTAVMAIQSSIAGLSAFPSLQAELGGVQGKPAGTGVIPADIFAPAMTKDNAVPVEERGEDSELARAVSFLCRIPDVELAAQAAPRYWQPNDPVLHLTSSAQPSAEAEPASASFVNGAPVCMVVEDFALPKLDSAEALDGLWKSLGSDLKSWTKSGWGLSWVTGAQCDPLFFEWEMGVEPFEGNLVPERRRLDKNFILRNYHLKEKQVEFLSVQGESRKKSPTQSYLSGRGILSAHAPQILREQIDRYLSGLMTAYLKQAAKSGSDDPARETYLAELGKADDDRSKRQAWFDTFFSDTTKVESFVSWCEAQQETKVAKLSPDAGISGQQSAIRTAVLARQKLAGQQTRMLSQSLSGFNENLLMEQQVLQFDPADPLGFAGYRVFSEKTVAAATRDHAHTAPLPFSDFHPIRSGEATLRRLQMIDSFGVVTPVDPSAGSTNSAQFGTARESYIALPPRIVQPARLNFRWVSARRDDIESNVHPLTSPVCGWVVCNNLELSLMIHDEAGAMLGSVDQTGRWRPVPDHSGLGLVSDLHNPHLRDMVGWIIARAEAEPGFVAQFIDRVEKALDNIDPEDFQHHQATALFMSRPLALVRASVSLEIKGLPAFNHSWEALLQVLGGNDLEDDGLSNVKFPIRIGEHGQLNDGVAGFWVDDADPHGAHRFLSPQLDMGEQLRPPTDASKGSGPRAPLNFVQSIADAPSFISILMDPRGSVHCTSGILPTKELRLPKDHYLPGLRAIRPQFLTSPILTPAGTTEIPLAAEADWSWEWVHAEGQDWVYHRQVPVLEFGDLLAECGFDGDQHWADLIAAGWIVQLPGPQRIARVVPVNERPDLPQDLQGQSDLFKRLLVSLPKMLKPAQTSARFGPTSILREGWLRMKPESTREGADTSGRETQ